MSKGRTGRHPLPDAQRLVARLREWGLDNDSEVVLYDDGPGAFAARAWWLLVWLGKRNGVAILDGGLKAWHAAHLPLSLDSPPKREGTFSGEPDAKLLIDADHLGKRLGSTDLTLIDARAVPRFRGEVEPIDRWRGIFPGPSARRLPTTWGLMGASCLWINSSSALPKSWLGGHRSSWCLTAGLG